MDNFAEYIESFEPGYRTSLRPATATEIARLEAAVGHPIPKPFREMLEVAGHGLGSFQPCGEGREFDIDKLIDWYEGRKRKPPTAFTMIARDYGDGGIDIFLEDIPGVEPQVVECAGNRSFDEGQHFYSILYESLPQMLFGMAFYLFQINRKSHRATLEVRGEVDQFPQARESRLREFGKAVGRYGMTGVKHTGGWFPCYSRVDAWACCYQPPLAAPFYRLAAASERQTYHLAEVLADSLGLVITDS